MSLFFFLYFLQFLLIFWSFFFFFCFVFCWVSISFCFCLGFMFLVLLRLVFAWVFYSLFCFLNINCKQTLFLLWERNWFFLFFVLFFEHQLQADLWHLATRICGAWRYRYRGHALDIFHALYIHGPESMHKNGIGKTFTHTSIPNQPCTLLRQRAKPSTHQTWRLRLVVLFLSNVMVGDGQEAWVMLLSTAPTSEAFSPRTVLTENICRCVQQIIDSLLIHIYIHKMRHGVERIHNHTQL